MTGNFSDSSAVSLAGAILANATITTGTILTAMGSSTLTGVTLAGQLNVTSSLSTVATLTVNGGLTLDNGTVQLNGAWTYGPPPYLATLALAGAGTQTLGGTGQVIFAGNNSATPSVLVDVLDSTQGPLILGSGISVTDTTAGGTLGNSAEALTINGTVTASGGQTMIITGSSVSNVGSGTNSPSLQATGGALAITNLQGNAGGIAVNASGTLTLNGAWQNTGAISEAVASATINLGGTFTNTGTTSSGLGTITSPRRYDQPNRDARQHGPDTDSEQQLEHQRQAPSAAARIAIANGFQYDRPGQQHPGGSDVGGPSSTVTSSLSNAATLTVNGGLTLDNGTVQLNGAWTYGPPPYLATSGACRVLRIVHTELGGNSAGGDLRRQRNSATPSVLVDTLDSTQGPLTLGSGINVTDTSAGGTLGNSAEALTINGTVTASGGQTMIITGSSVSNAGSGSNSPSLQATGGALAISNLQSNAGGIAVNANGTLILNGAWQNTGAISEAVASATINLGGIFTNTGTTSSGLGTITQTAGTVNLTGTLTNTGQTLTLNSNWNINGGAISGGYHLPSPTASNLIALGSSSTLTGVTLAGQLNVTSILGTAATLTVNGGLMLNNGTVQINGFWSPSGYFDPATLALAGTGTQTLGGAGQVIFAGNNSATPSVLVDTLDSTQGPLTLGSGIVSDRRRAARRDSGQLGGGPHHQWHGHRQRRPDHQHHRRLRHQQRSRRRLRLPAGQRRRAGRYQSAK